MKETPLFFKPEVSETDENHISSLESNGDWYFEFDGPFTFEEILKKGDFILLDNCLQRKNRINKWFEDIYECKFFTELNEDLLERIHEYTTAFHQQFLHKNTYTVPFAFEEIAYFYEKIKESFDFYNDNHLSFKYCKRKRTQGKRKERILEKGHAETKKEKYSNIVWDMLQAKKKARSSLYKKNDDLFLFLNSILLWLSENKGKGNNSYQKSIYRKKIENVYADEQLVSSLAYHSIVEEEQGIIATADKDVSSLLRSLYGFFCLAETPLLQSCAEKFRQHPAQCFYEVNGEFFEHFNSENDLASARGWTDRYFDNEDMRNFSFMAETQLEHLLNGKDNNN